MQARGASAEAQAFDFGAFFSGWIGNFGVVPSFASFFFRSLPWAAFFRCRRASVLLVSDIVLAASFSAGRSDGQTPASTTRATARRYAWCSRFVIGPGFPDPIVRPSADTTGMTSRMLLVRKASSAS